MTRLDCMRLRRLLVVARSPQPCGGRACSVEDLMDMTGLLLKKATFAAEKQASMLLWQTTTCGRGDEARSRRFNEIMAPLYRQCIGEPLRTAWRRGMGC